jgi:hypothetical protein
MYSGRKALLGRLRLPGSALIIFVLAFLFAGQAVAVDRQAELESFSRYVDEALPAVAQMTGIRDARPVPVVMLMRSEVRDYLLETLERDYPDEDLERRGRCLAALGLVPEGYDLEAGLIHLITQEAGAFYDPSTDDMKGIADLDPALKTPQAQRMIVSHELTHALQDRVVDIASLYLEAIVDMDREYCLRAVIEGMASNVMLAYMNDVALKDLPDVQQYMRSAFNMKYGASGGTSLGGSPLYVKESLLSPYAEGGGFVQTWIRRNPGSSLKDLLLDMPSTSEQAMHYDKFQARDEAAPIDPSLPASVVPADWELYYANTLGEFDILMLFKSHAVADSDARQLAAGWDGCRWQAYLDDAGDLGIVGVSVWDSEEDAADFEAGLAGVLSGLWGEGAYRTLRDGDRVGFLIGAAAGRSRQLASALERLAAGRTGP